MQDQAAGVSTRKSKLSVPTRFGIGQEKCALVSTLLISTRRATEARTTKVETFAGTRVPGYPGQLRVSGHPVVNTGARVPGAIAGIRAPGRQHTR